MSATKFIVMSDNRPVEKVTILPQAWDSGILGMVCARLDEFVAESAEPAPSYDSLVAELRRLKLEYVIARRPQGEGDRIQALERSGFVRVDGIVQFEKELSAGGIAASVLASPYRARLATADDADSVGKLSARIFTKTRFHNDKLLSTELAERVHFEWGRNSCLGLAAKAVWLIMQGHRVAGFVTCGLNGATGSIILIGVDAKDSGLGLGKALVQMAAQWVYEQGCKRMTVQTQTDNMAAIKLYESTGFRIRESYVTLRWAAR